MHRITVLTSSDEGELPGLEALAGEAEVRHVTGEAELRDALQRDDVLVVTDFRSGLIERAWPRAAGVQWVHATSAGVDPLCFPALMESGIPVTNARGVFDRGIAEYVLGAILLFAKDTIGNLQLQRERRWKHRETELVHQRQVLVIGAGSIGGEVARLLRACDMRVTGIARSAREDPAFDAVHAQSELDRLLPDADFVVITAPLTEDTHHLFDRERISRMKPGARLINVGRGPIVRTEDLLAALREGQLAGAALDVFEEEPLPPEHPLWDLPNVMLSAHMAGDFIGWRHALGKQFVENFRRWREGETLFNQVDLHRYGAGSNNEPRSSGAN